MRGPIVSKQKADILSAVVGIISLAFLLYWQILWPEAVLVVAVVLMLRQFLRGRRYDMLITCGVIGGWYVTLSWKINWDTIVPVILTVGALYIIFREYFIIKERVGIDQIEDANQEIEDAKHHE